MLLVPTSIGPTTAVGIHAAGRARPVVLGMVMLHDRRARRSAHLLAARRAGSLGRRFGVRPDGHGSRGCLIDGARVQFDPAFGQADRWPFHNERERPE
jgi:hypothetical protein